MQLHSLTTKLIQHFNPVFLDFETFDNNINIVISAHCFINQSMPDRVRSVYKCLEEKCPSILEKHQVFVHTFTEDELTDFLQYNQEGANE